MQALTGGALAAGAVSAVLRAQMSLRLRCSGSPWQAALRGCRGPTRRMHPACQQWLAQTAAHACIPQVWHMLSKVLLTCNAAAALHRDAKSTMSLSCISFSYHVKTGSHFSQLKQ